MSAEPHFPHSGSRRDDWCAETKDDLVLLGMAAAKPAALEVSVDDQMINAFVYQAITD
jgi:hypothetical protein